MEEYKCHEPDIKREKISSEKMSIIEFDGDGSFVECFLMPEKGIPEIEVFREVIEYAQYKSMKEFSNSILLSIMHCCFAAIENHSEKYASEALCVINDILFDKKELVNEINEDEIAFITHFVASEMPDYILSQVLAIIELLISSDKTSMNDELYSVLLSIYEKDEESNFLSKRRVFDIIKSAFLKLDEPNDNLVSFIDMLFNSLNESDLEISLPLLKTIHELLMHFINYEIEKDKIEKLIPFTLITNTCFCIAALEIIECCVRFDSNISTFINCGLVNVLSRNKLRVYPSVIVIIYRILGAVSEHSKDYCALCLNSIFIKDCRIDELPFTSKYEMQRVLSSAVHWKLINSDDKLFEMFISNITENGKEFSHDVLVHALQALLDIELDDVSSELIDTINEISSESEDEQIDVLCKKFLDLYDADDDD